MDDSEVQRLLNLPTAAFVREFRSTLRLPPKQRQVDFASLGLAIQLANGLRLMNQISPESGAFIRIFAGVLSDEATALRNRVHFEVDRRHTTSLIAVGEVEQRDGCGLEAHFIGPSFQIMLTDVPVHSRATLQSTPIGVLARQAFVNPPPDLDVVEVEAPSAHVREGTISAVMAGVPVRELEKAQHVNLLKLTIESSWSKSFGAPSVSVPWYLLVEDPIGMGA